MLQEVFAAAWPRYRHVSLVVSNSTEQFEIRLQVIANFANGGQIPASIAVVRCTPHGHHILIVEVIFVSLVDQLMCSSDKLKSIDVAKFLCHSISEEPA